MKDIQPVMTIKLYNTLSRAVETFKPLAKDVVSIYQCGPTVYDTPHLGNYRTFILGDLVRRVFEYNDYDIRQVMNITDVDDKTIHKSREEGATLSVVTQRYEALFLEGLKDLNIEKPLHLIRATEHIDSMVKLIEDLIEKGAAYVSEDGVYFDVSKAQNYGALAGLGPIDRDETHSHERINNDEYDKDNVRDFALWKFQKEDDGDVHWEAPFGAGRPGWHIECSAMSMELLGPTIDVHIGGADLIFPHHSNEIAQSESATGKKFVDYWIHGAYMNIKDEKMAKSKGNFLKLDDLVEQSISPLAFRYWLLTAHYRSPVNFTLEAVRAAQQALMRLMTTLGNLPEGGKLSTEYAERFKGYINDDLDTPKVVALIWDLIKDINVSDADKRATIIDMDRVLGLRLSSIPIIPEEEIPEEIRALADAREGARAAKDWAKADALRQEIEVRGYTVSDTKSGIKIYPRNL